MGALRRLIDEVNAELTRLMDAGELRAMIARQEKQGGGMALRSLVGWLKDTGLLAIFIPLRLFVYSENAAL